MNARLPEKLRMSTRVKLSGDRDRHETQRRDLKDSEKRMGILQKQGGLKVTLISLHGLIRGHNLELGPDWHIADVQIRWYDGCEQVDPWKAKDER
jgi:hypothetical protein